MSTDASTTTSTALHQFVIYAPDKTEEGTFEKRLAVRSQHLAKLRDLIGRGYIKLGGVMLTPESIETATSDKKMTGSVLIMEAENINAARNIVQNDIYYTSGVWDPEKLVIAPILLVSPQSS